MAPLDSFFTTAVKPKAKHPDRCFISMQRKSRLRKLALNKRNRGDILRARPVDGKKAC